MLIRFRQQQPIDPRRPLPADKTWHAILTRPQREHATAHWLERIGWHTFVPLIHSRVSSRRRGRAYHQNGKKQKSQFPLIPRIVFGATDKPVQASMLREYCPHILGLIPPTGEPIAIPSWEIEQLQQASASLLNPPQAFKPGDTVRITGADNLITIKELTAKYAIAAQNWFGAEREIKVEIDRLEAAP